MCTEYANTEEQIEATNNINKTDRAGCESKKKVYLDEFIPFPTVISTKYIQAQSDPYNTPMTETDMKCNGIKQNSSDSNRLCIILLTCFYSSYFMSIYFFFFLRLLTTHRFKVVQSIVN